MSRPNFVVKVPLVPIKSRPRYRRMTRIHRSENFTELQTIDESNITKNSSYYSIKSPDPSESKLKVIETYDEYLDLKDLEKIYWKTPSKMINSNEASNEGLFLLKQICAELNMDISKSEKGSLFQCENSKTPSDIRTAIIAQRIVDTQSQINSKKKGYSSESLRRNSCNRSVKSLGTIDKISSSSIIFQVIAKALTHITTEKRFSNLEVQTNLMSLNNQHKVTRNCNTQTYPDDVQLIYNFSRNQAIQSSRKSINKDKYTNTPKISFYPRREHATQMYEHITGNDLLCMEWIDKNLFRVPVNPNTIVVDERLKETSEVTCAGSNFFEQELNWERQALRPLS